MKIRYVLEIESPVVSSLDNESQTICIELDTYEAPLEQLLKKLPQTAFVKRWSADVLEAVTPPLEQSTEDEETFDEASFGGSVPESVRALRELLTSGERP